MYIIERVYTIAAFIALVALLFVVTKYITKRLKKNGFQLFKSVDLKLMKIHKLAAFILIISGGLHGILSLSRFNEFGIRPYVLGTISLLSCIATARSFYIKKNYKETKHWIVHHRIFALIAFITLIGHITLSR